MKLMILPLALTSLLILAAAGCSKAPEEKSKLQENSVTVMPPPAPLMSYEPLIVSDGSVSNLFTVEQMDSGNAIDYTSRAGVTNLLDSVVQYPDATGYVKIERAYKFGEKYIFIVSTGENGASCPATTYVFAFDIKTESVTGKKDIDGCSEIVESLSDGNKLIVKKDGASSTFYNGDIQ